MQNNQDLSSKAMLIKLSISQWSAKKTDKKASAEVQANHNAAAKSGRYNKNLVSKAAIQAVQKCANSARTFHYENSLPWNDSGFRILPAANFDKYSNGMRELHQEFDNAVRAFISDYPLYVDAAKAELGTLFDHADYPSDTVIFREFSFDTEIQPLPTAADFRVKLRDQDVQSIQHQISSTFNSNIEQANRSLWKRLYDATSHMADTLSKEDTIFRDSLIKNLCNLCDILPALNLTGDPQLEEMRREIETRLCTFEPQELRDNPAERSNAATEADAIAAMMSGYMGGSQ